jgi:hypothetical protein
MKNLYLLQTDKPSRLWTNNLRRRLELDEFIEQHPTNIAKHIYITSDEEIKEDDWGLSKLNEVILFGRSYNEKFYKKIILTTDTDLIADGVKSIDDDFLEWFVKNPNCEFVEVEKECIYKGKCKKERCLNHPCNEKQYKIIIPQEEPTPVWKQIIESCGGEEEFMESAGLKPKKETLEESAKKYTRGVDFGTSNDYNAFIEGAKWQQERMYSLDEIKTAMKNGYGIKYFSEHKFLENLKQLKTK